jgi:hypothetical protein
MHSFVSPSARNPTHTIPRRPYIYLYGAVAPKDGTCVYLILPTSNTACFQAFLDALSRRFARQQILLVLDGVLANPTSTFCETDSF